MKYKLKKSNNNDPIYKEGFTISSIKNYFQSKKEKGLKPLFFKKIGDRNTSRDEMLQNLIKTLKENGWKIKGGSNGDS
jgi:hypothetical protein